MKRTAVLRGQSSIFKETFAFGDEKFLGEDNERRRGEDKDEYSVGCDRCGEVLQRYFGVEDLISDHSRDATGVGKDKDTEEALRFSDEAEATCLIGMGGKELQVQPAYFAEEAKPEEDAPEPTKYEEVHQRRTEEDEPPTCPGASEFTGSRRDGVPRGSGNGEPLRCEERDEIGDDDNNQFCHDGIAQP